MLLDTDTADVHFTFGPEEPREDAAASDALHGHRALLSARSPVFKAMFSRRTGMRESATGDVTVHIGDASPSAFACLLRFCYTDELVNDDSVTVDMFEVAQLSSRYALPRLQALCVEEMRRSLSADNAVRLMVRCAPRGRLCCTCACVESC